MQPDDGPMGGSTRGGPAVQADESERETLLATLQDQRNHVLETLEGLSEHDLHRAVLPSGWTPLGLVRHLTVDVERFWFRRVIAGEDVEFPSDHEVWHAGAQAPSGDVVGAYRAEARLSDAVVRARELGSRPVTWPLPDLPGVPDRDVRGTLLHVITETAAHAGHLDVVRELLDGRLHLVLTDFSQPADAPGLS